MQLMDISFLKIFNVYCVAILWQENSTLFYMGFILYWRNGFVEILYAPLKASPVFHFFFLIPQISQKTKHHSPLE